MGDQLLHDPCPGAQRVGGLNAFQHPYAVSCSECGRLLQFAWLSDAGLHLCGRCKRRRART